MIVGAQTTGITGAGVAATVPGFTLIAEDGNLVPSVTANPSSTTTAAAPRVQSDVFMAAGKTYDVMVNVPAATAPAMAVFSRDLALSADAVGRDGGMLAYIGANAATLPASPTLAPAAANPDTYNSLVPCTVAPCLGPTVSDPGKGVIANDVNVYGVHVLAAPTGGTLVLNANGTFTYVQTAGTTSDSFSYCANGFVTGTTCSSGLTATVTLGAAAISGAPTAPNITYNASVAGYLAIKDPGVLAGATDPSKYPLTVAVPGVTTSGSLTVNMSASGAFTATLNPPNTAATTASFTYQAKNSQGTLSAAATVTINFPAPSNLTVTLLDGKTKAAFPWRIGRREEEPEQGSANSQAAASHSPAVSLPVVGEDLGKRSTIPSE